jgi:hypothetical protein
MQGAAFRRLATKAGEKCGLMLVKVDMFLAAIRLLLYHQDGGFGYMNPAILALAYIFRFARLELLGLRVTAKQSFQ